MKRSLVFCAIALVAVVANSALAQVGVQLNLQYTDPNDISQGGTWQLLVESEGDGVAGLVAAISNISTASEAGITTGASTNSAIWNVLQSQEANPGEFEIVAGDDLVSPTTDIGVDGGANNVVDDLYTNGSSPSPWQHSSLVAQGTFADGNNLPAFITIGSINSTTAANTINGAGDTVSAVLAQNISGTVRGDSIADGLRPGDANRDGQAGPADLAILSAPSNWLNGSAGWNQGNFNSAAGTGPADLAILSAPSNWLSQSASPAVGAAVAGVPEPTTAVMLAGMLTLVAASRRRS